MELFEISISGEEAIAAELNKLEGEVINIDELIKREGLDLDLLDDNSDRLILDTNRKIAKCRNDLDLLKMQGDLTFHNVHSMVTQSYGILNQVLGVFGHSIGGVLGASVQAAFSISGMLYSMATAQAVTPFMQFHAAQTFIGAALTLTAAIIAEQKKQEITRGINRTQQFLSRYQPATTHFRTWW